MNYKDIDAFGYIEDKSKNAETFLEIVEATECKVYDTSIDVKNKSGDSILLRVKNLNNVITGNDGSFVAFFQGVNNICIVVIFYAEIFDESFKEELRKMIDFL